LLRACVVCVDMLYKESSADWTVSNPSVYTATALGLLAGLQLSSSSLYCN